MNRIAVISSILIIVFATNIAYSLGKSYILETQYNNGVIEKKIIGFLNNYMLINTSRYGVRYIEKWCNNCTFYGENATTYEAKIMRGDKLGFTVRIDYLKTLDMVVSGVIVSKPPIEDIKTLHSKLRKNGKLLVANLSNALEYIRRSLSNIGRISVSDNFKKLSTILARNISILGYSGV